MPEIASPNSNTNRDSTHRRRQIHKARITCPEELIGRCDRIAVDRDLALPALALLVVRPSGGSRSRAEQNVPVRKKCRKGAPQPMPLIVELQPIPVRQLVAAHRQIEIGLLSSVDFS